MAMPSMPSLRARLTGVAVAIVALVLVALAIVLYIAARGAAWRQHDDVLAARARAIAASAEHDEDYEITIPVDARGEPATYAEAWRPDGSALARSPALRADLPHAFADGDAPRFFDLELPDGRTGRAVALRFVPHDEGTRPATAAMTVVLAAGVEDVDQALGSLGRWFVATAIAALVLVAAATAWSVARGLRPLGALATRLEQIDDRNLATRLPDDDQPAELAVPIGKLNELLARLEQSFARERQFTADVGHELRTPLAGLRTLLEVTALADRSTAEYRAALGDALDTVRQLAAVVENLLALARLDAGQVELERGEVALAPLVDECWRPHAALAASRALAFRNEVAPDAIATTDRDKLRIVVGNLLANAAAYTASGGWIAVRSGGDALVEVTDSGPPIAAADLERIFDRMWRGDAARAATGVHCGIGLALSRALCAKLSLSLTARSTEDGRVSFRIA